MNFISLCSRPKLRSRQPWNKIKKSNFVHFGFVMMWFCYNLSSNTCNLFALCIPFELKSTGRCIQVNEWPKYFTKRIAKRTNKKEGRTIIVSPLVTAKAIKLFSHSKPYVYWLSVNSTSLGTGPLGNIKGTSGWLVTRINPFNST